MNRTERLYALVEELRAVSPRPRSAAWLARRFEVSVRTVERDLDALRQSGVPIWSQPGRAGGYGVDRDRTLPPLALTPAEALAITVALRAAGESPFAEAARSASLKVLGALPAQVRRQEAALASVVHAVGDGPGAPDSGPLAGDSGAVVFTAVQQRRVLHLAYADRAGSSTERDVEPLGLLWGSPGWYLLAWCRLRGAVRGFRLDRIRSARLTDERAPDRGAARRRRRELARINARPLTQM
jgi:predicted DNA-binding transcriptional regulator YafY